MDKFLAGMIAGAILTFAATRLLGYLKIFLPWKRAFMSGARTSVVSIIAMRMRGCPPVFLVDAFCSLVHSGHDVTIAQVESCYLARKHEISENDIGAFIQLVKEFVATQRHDADSTGTRPPEVTHFQGCE